MVNDKADALGFAFFRVGYAAVLLLELRQLLLFEDLIFPPTGLFPPLLVEVLLVVWGMTLCFLLAGWFTRYAAIGNYMISVAVVWAMPDFKYHLDYIMISVNFLLIWLPVSATLSLDADWRRRKTGYRPPQQVSAGWTYLVAVLPLGLVYLDSVVYKLTSPMWLSGLGFWLPSSLPQNAQTDLSWILNQEQLVKGIGYGIMVFEFAFLFLIWFRPLRLLLVVGGLLLHAGIGVAYPIPHFSLVMMALYLPLIPAGCWQRLRQGSHWFFGGNSRRPLATPVALPRPRWGVAFLLYCCLGQLLCLTLTPLFQNAAARLGLQPALAGLQTVAKPVFFLNQKFLGVVPHDIFLDKHFRGYRQLVSLWYVPPKGAPVLLPLLNLQGQPAPYCVGRVWTKWAYRVTGPNPDPQQRAAGLQSFTAFWARQQQISLHQARFQVVTKAVAVPAAWQPDHLKKQLRQPWQVAGTVLWQHQTCQLLVPGW